MRTKTLVMLSKAKHLALEREVYAAYERNTLRGAEILRWRSG